MKTRLLLWFLLGLSLNITAQDFSLQNDDGLTLKYSVIDETKKLVRFFELVNYDSQKPLERLAIPKEIVYNNSTYRVSSIFLDKLQNYTIGTLVIPEYTDMLKVRRVEYKIQNLEYNAICCSNGFSIWEHISSQITIGPDVQQINEYKGTLPEFKIELKASSIYYNATDMLPLNYYLILNNIQSLTIGPNVKRIPKNLFYTLYDLKQVNIPQNVEEIGSDAFFPTVHLNGWNPTGPTITLDRETCNWNKVYMACSDYEKNTFEKYYHFPGVDCTETMSYTFYIPTQHTTYIKWNDGTQDNMTSDIYIEKEESLHCKLQSQNGKDITCILSKPDGKIRIPEDNFQIRLKEQQDQNPGCRIRLKKPQTGNWANASIWVENKEISMTDTGDGYFEYTVNSDISTPFSFNIYDADKRFIKTLTAYNGTLSIELNSEDNRTYTSHCVLETDSIMGYPCTKNSIVCSDNKRWPATWNIEENSKRLSSYYVENENDAWAISPIIDLTNSEHLSLAFTLRVPGANKIEEKLSKYFKLMVTADDINWQEVPIVYPSKSDTYYIRQVVSLDSYASDRLRIAFRHICTEQEQPSVTVYDIEITSTHYPNNCPTYLGMDMVIGPYPESEAHFYDIDQDGQMEYITDKGIYDNRGYELSFFKNNKDEEVVLIDDLNRDGKPEIIKKTDKNILQIQQLDGTVVDQIEYNFYNLVSLDANNDGRTDLFLTKDDAFRMFYQKTDGTFIGQDIEIITDEEAINNALFAQYGENPIVQPPINFGGASLAKAPQQKSPDYDRVAAVLAYKGPEAIDINMDGLPDLLNLYNGNALLSLGNNRYYYGNFGGSVTAKDLNGDGIPDFVVFNEKEKTVTLYLYEGNNSFKEQLLMQNFNITGVHCYDYDKDGDIDILLPFDYAESSQYSYLVFYENQGNNVFKKRERSTQQPFKFLECADFDNDGLYEVLAYHPRIVSEDNTYQLYQEFYLLECQTGFDFRVEETPVLSHKYPYTQGSNVITDNILRDHPEIVTGDFDADGRTEYFVQFSHHVKPIFDLESRVFLGEFKAGKPNTPPARMEAPTFLTDAASHTLRVEWKMGSDAETQPKDLTYALRIGTGPGKDDIWTGYANTAGTRLRTGAGNASSNLYQLINTQAWGKGDYYIAVQAIDPSGLASPWSEETLFTNNVLAVDYLISSPMITTTDTLHVVLNTPFQPDYQYAWDFGEGSEVIQSTDTEWQVVYHQAGSKTMRLTVTDEEGLTADKERSLYVQPVYMRRWTHMAEGQGDVEYQTYTGRFMDLNMDGNNDLIGTMKQGWSALHGVLQNDGKGNFQKVGRTYNSDFEPSTSHRAEIIDYNMDGLPDFVVPSNKGNLFINEGDFDFTYSTEDLGTLYNNQRAVYIDFNNDGYKDFLLDTSLRINQGDNRTFQEINLGDFSPTLQDAIAVDIDRDGWIDIVGIGRLTDQQGEICILRNKGNLTFEVLPSLTIIQPDKNSLFKLYAADMNNDGYVDIIIAFEQELRIYWGNQDLSYTQHTYWKNEHTKEIFYTDLTLFDLDNNGYLDIYASTRVFYFYPGPEIVVQDKHLGDYYDSGITYDLNGNGVPDTYYFEIQSRHTNTPPQTPANVRAIQAHDFVTLYWDPATDSESPSTQIRYNISLKKAGQSGENSYLLSPLNGTSDQASPIAEVLYPYSTQLSMPIDRFKVGENYELKVQAIDPWGAHSPFSETYTFTVESKVGIDGPEQTCRYSEITLEYRGTESGTPVWQLDGGTVVRQENNLITVFWETTGTKTVSVEVNGQVSTRPIKVNENLDLSFTLPDYVLTGASVPFTLPGVFAEAGKIVGVRTSDQQDIQSSSLTFTGKSPIPDTDNKIQVERRGTTLDARVTFPEDCADSEGKVWIELYCIDPVCGETTWRQEVTLAASNITPQITLVTADATTGKNKIIWKTPSDLPEGLFRGMAIYKESGSTNNFVKIDEVPVDAEMYIDQQSDPTIRKNRYRIALATVYDSYSTQSDTHSSVHVMLNKGMGNDINIVWTPYEGGTLEQYTILRGTSPENMNLLTTASGFETSYTDKTVQEGVTYYYALSYSNLYQDNWNPMNSPARHARANGQITGQSNLVSSSGSNTVTFAESVSINTIEKEAELTPNQQTLHLYAEIMPAMASYKQVNWQISGGNHLAQINSAGVLTYQGNGQNGTVTVQATTIDGTNLSAVIEIPVQGFTVPEIKVNAIEISSDNTLLTPDQPSTQLYVKILPENATDQRVVWSLTTGADIAEITSAGMVTALGQNGTVTVRATACDGSGVYGELSLLCTDFVSVQQTENDDIRIYPIPATTVLNISCPFEIRQLLIIASDGHPVQSYNGNLKYLSVSHLPAGVYFLQITGQNNEQKQLRFIVTR